MTLELLLLQCLPVITSAGALAAELLKQGFADQLAEELGHHGAQRLDQLREAILKYAEKNRSLPSNYDLQKTLYLSFLSATEIIYQTRLVELGVKIERSWLAGLRRELLSHLPPAVEPLEINETEKQHLNRKLFELREELMKGSSIGSDDLQARLPLVPSADLLRRLATEVKRSAPLSQCVTDDILGTSHWYKDAGVHVQRLAHERLWDYVGRFFVEEIKTNERVSRILNSDLLADAGITLEDIKKGLGGIGAIIKEISEKVDAVRNLIESEFQQEFQVIDVEFIQSQRTRQLQPLLNISVGDWPFVAQKKSLQREAARLVVERVLLTSKDIIFQVIRGEPGSGKTTLLRQVGAMLVDYGCHVVEVRSDADLSNFQFYARRLAKEAGSRLFILVDDIYRDDRSIVIEFLCDPGTPFPATIIGTTPSYEDRTEEIRNNTFLSLLNPVSSDELSDRELNDLHHMPEFSQMTDRKFLRLTKSRKILPVLLGLKGGEEFATIIANTARRLRENHKRMYEAWGVVTTFGRWNLPVPNSLLEAMLGEPHFSYEIRNSPDAGGSRGLIFPSSYLFKEGWSPSHQLIGQAAFERTYSGRQKEYCEKAIIKGDPGQAEHCHFVARMFKRLHSPKAGDRELALDLFHRHEKRVLDFADSWPGLGVYWGATMLAMKHKHLARHYLLNARPANPLNAQYHCSLLSKIGEFSAALELAEAWCESHPEDKLVRRWWLAVVRRRGNHVQIAKALQSTTKWVAVHKDNTSGQEGYNRLVDAYCSLTLTLADDSGDDIERAVRSTEMWLSVYDRDATGKVRAQFLRGVERLYPGHLRTAVMATRHWLDKNPLAAEAWLALAEVVNNHVDSLQVDGIARAAFEVNPGNTKVLYAYVSYCRKDMSRDALHTAIETIRSSVDIAAQLRCADWLSEAKYYVEAQQLFDKLSFQLGDSGSFLYRYGWHLFRQEKYVEAKERFRKLLAKKPMHAMAHESMGQALKELAKQADENEDFSTAERYRREAETHFLTALTVAEKAKSPGARFHASLGWLYYRWKRFDEALVQFELALVELPNFANYWGKGAILTAYKSYKKALPILRQALDLAPHPLEPPASEEIPSLIAECEKALGERGLSSLT